MKKIYIHQDEGTKSPAISMYSRKRNIWSMTQKSRFLFMKFIPTKILSSISVCIQRCKMKQFPTSTSQQFSWRNDTDTGMEVSSNWP